jgi:VWFA-related protein
VIDKTTGVPDLEPRSYVMKRGKLSFGIPAAIILSVLALQSVARADDFGKIVDRIEKNYNAKKKKIPFLGLAGFAVKVIRPAGVKGFKFAIFEDQDFAMGARDREFEQAVASSLDKKWTPTVSSKDRVSGNRSWVYSRQDGKDLEVLTVTITNKQAFVAQAKVNPEAAARFMEKPQIMGFSIGGGGGFNRSISILDPSSSIYSGKPAIDTSDSSLDSLRASGFPTTDTRSKPVLSRGSESDSTVDSTNSEPAEVAREKADPDAIRLEARLINLNVKATDRSGRSLSTLNKEDFRIQEDGVEQQIFYFEPISAPINVVLLLDLSGSTRDNRSVMINTAKNFIDSLGAQDRIAVAAFTRKFVLASDFTTDKKELKKAVDKMKKISGGTAFYDGMWATLDLLRRVKDSRKAIVVLTDGVDESLLESGREESNHSFEELLARVGEEDATIYPLYLKKEETDLTNELKNPNLTEWRRHRLERRLAPNLAAHRQVEQIAEESAGSVFVVEGENELDGVYQKVAAELRLIYSLAYASTNTSHDGKFRKINVSVKHEGAVARTRRGYVAR